jgi:threonine synthase
MGFQLALKLGFTLPDVILYPTGGGTGLIKKAFAELEAIGLIGRQRPRMVAVQASGCAPIVRACAAGKQQAKRVDDARTIASGIRVPKAIGDFLILEAVRASGGFAIAVDDEEILAARDEVARTEGLHLCPEGAATWAAYRRAREQGLIAAASGSCWSTVRRA